MQEHPDTVGGAMLTGVREAVRALRMLKGASEEESNAAAGAVDGGLPSRKRKQVSALAIPVNDQAVGFLMHLLASRAIMLCVCCAGTKSFGTRPCIKQ